LYDISRTSHENSDWNLTRPVAALDFDDEIQFHKTLPLSKRDEDKS